MELPVLSTWQALRVLLGRDLERELIAATLDRACAGTSGTVVIVGEAGIGKSTLLDDAVRKHSAIMTVLAVGCLEAESDISFAGLTSLLRPILHLVDDLPAAHGTALRKALAMSTGPTNELAVGAATLGLLARAGEQQPVLVAVDDAQWIDEPSARALGFALHRLDADRVAGLITVRSAQPTPLNELGFTAMPLAGLDADAAFELMSLVAPIARDVADRCHEASAGNPLALIEIGAGLNHQQRIGARGLDEALAIGTRLTTALGDRVAAIGDQAQQAVLIAALADRPELGTIIGALDEVGVRRDALDEAERAGIVAIHDAELHFTHPLLRTAAAARADPAARRAAHAALAAALAGRDGDRERRSWHLAGAAVGPDETAAAALEATAAAARARGGPSSAATALERASRLSPEPHSATRRLIAAGDAHWDASGPHLAIAAWQTALAATTDRSMHAGIAGRIGEAQAWFVDSVAAVEFLVVESSRARTHDVPGAVGLLVRASMMSGLVGDMGRAVALADDAVDLAASDEGLLFAARAARALARVNHGDERAAAADLALVDALAADAAQVAEVDKTVLMFLQIAAFSQSIREDWDRARSTVATVIEHARRTGMHAVVAFAAALRADIGWRTGRWAEARADAGTAIAFSRAVSSKNASFGHAVLARIDACVGADTSCRTLAGEASEMSRHVHMASLQMWSDAAVGLLELGAGRPAAAVTALAGVAASCRAGEVLEPGFLWWQADLAEAAIEAGVAELAERTLGQLQDQAPRTDRRWTAVAIGRTSGLLDPPNGADHFAASIDAAAALGAPFERARTQLCWAVAELGTNRVRARRNAAAAMDVFCSLGAEPWTSRCEAVLGLRAARAVTPRAIAAQLTAAELRVALAIGAGASSREAADLLYVSVRTVEFHLGSIYRRLGIRSRTELALAIDRERRLSDYN